MKLENIKSITTKENSHHAGKTNNLKNIIELFETNVSEIQNTGSRSKNLSKYQIYILVILFSKDSIRSKCPGKNHHVAKRQIDEV